MDRMGWREKLQKYHQKRNKPLKKVTVATMECKNYTSQIKVYY